jgi:hypothetical protein
MFNLVVAYINELFSELAGRAIFEEQEDIPKFYAERTRAKLTGT